MTCRHSKGDPNCGSNNYSYSSVSAPVTPDASNYTIEGVERVGLHLVLKVKYPNCASCAFEGSKVMVFLGIGEMQALKWRTIDPHFRKDPISLGSAAPSPAARFPATQEGWTDAISYARSKK